MYEALIAHLRECASLDPSNNTYKEAADAIEKLLQKEKFHAFLWNTIQPNEMEAYISMYNAGNEKVEKNERSFERNDI